MRFVSFKSTENEDIDKILGALLVRALLHVPVEFRSEHVDTHA